MRRPHTAPSPLSDFLETLATGAIDRHTGIKLVEATSVAQGVVVPDPLDVPDPDVPLPEVPVPEVPWVPELDEPEGLPVLELPVLELPECELPVLELPERWEFPCPVMGWVRFMFGVCCPERSSVPPTGAISLF